MNKFEIIYDKNNCAVSPDNFSDYKIGNIITNDPNMIDLIKVSLRVAKSDAPILITGESGVGKELLSELIHNNSIRKNNSFVKVNCASISENLKESEMFGYEPGSFTGASKLGKKGIIEASQNGTLFLDEVGEMPLTLQSTLLRVLQDGSYLKVGGLKEFQSNSRVICATNKDLRTLVNDGSFRNDLYFRLNVIPLKIPALRDRKNDIPLLILYFIGNFNKQYNLEKKITKEAMELMCSNKWYGNVRELRNTIERLILISTNDNITYLDLQYIDSILDKKDYVHYAKQDIGSFSTTRPLKDMVEEFELNLIRKSIEDHGSLRKAAKALSVTPSTLSRKLSKDK